MDRDCAGDPAGRTAFGCSVGAGNSGCAAAAEQHACTAASRAGTDRGRGCVSAGQPGSSSAERPRAAAASTTTATCEPAAHPTTATRQSIAADGDGSGAGTACRRGCGDSAGGRSDCTGETEAQPHIADSLEFDHRRRGRGRYGCWIVERKSEPSVRRRTGNWFLGRKHDGLRTNQVRQFFRN
jgi:hypothetical protein